MKLMSIKGLLSQISHPEKSNVDSMFFLPLYDEKYEIEGTQIVFNFKDKKIDAEIYELKNYSKEDYSITNKYCMMGYKVYNLEIKG
jgi:hypothetical protein